MALFSDFKSSPKSILLDWAEMNLLCIGQGRLYVGAGGPLRRFRVCNRDSHFLSHSYQLRQRVRAHLSHELTAMDLNRGFASSDFGGNLFIEKAGNYQWQTLPLPRCQPFKALSQCGNFRFSLTTGAVALQRELN